MRVFRVAIWVPAADWYTRFVGVGMAVGTWGHPGRRVRAR
jgi:hypothetical protein